MLVTLSLSLLPWETMASLMASPSSIGQGQCPSHPSLSNPLRTAPSTPLLGVSVSSLRAGDPWEWAQFPTRLLVAGTGQDPAQMVPGPMDSAALGEGWAANSPCLSFPTQYPQLSPYFMLITLKSMLATGTQPKATGSRDVTQGWGFRQDTAPD